MSEECREETGRREKEVCSVCEELRCGESKQFRLSPHREGQDQWRAVVTDRVDVME